MKTVPQRDQQILQMRRQGLSCAEVAHRFGLSRSRISVIERAFGAEKALSERRDRIRTELREADDPDECWALPDLMDALRWGDRFKVPLLKHFDGIGKRNMSVRELMDLAVTVREEGGVEQMKVPVLHICCIGKIGFRGLVAQLTEIDFGPRGSQIWKGKREVLARHWRI